MWDSLWNPTRAVSGVQTAVGGAVRLTSSRNSHIFKSWRENKTTYMLEQLDVRLIDAKMPYIITVYDMKIWLLLVKVESLEKAGRKCQDKAFSVYPNDSLLLGVWTAWLGRASLSRSWSLGCMKAPDPPAGLTAAEGLSSGLAR